MLDLGPVSPKCWLEEGCSLRCHPANNAPNPTASRPHACHDRDCGMSGLRADASAGNCSHRRGFAAFLRRRSSCRLRWTWNNVAPTAGARIRIGHRESENNTYISTPACWERAGELQPSLPHNTPTALLPPAAAPAPLRAPRGGAASSRCSADSSAATSKQQLSISAQLGATAARRPARGEQRDVDSEPWLDLLGRQLLR